MSKVRVLVGTRKGAFVLESDGKREKWDVSGPHFTGWEIYHVKGSPADPNRLYASQSSGWFGQVIQRSNDGGKTWEAPGGGVTMEPGRMPRGESNRFVYDTSAETGKPLTTHQFYDGTQHPWEFKRVWHLEPSLTRSGHGLRRGGGRRHLPLDRRREVLAGTRRPARPRHRTQVAAGRGRHVPAHHPDRSDESPTNLHRHLRRGRLPHRRRRQDVEAHQQGAEVAITFPIPKPRSATACTASRCTRRAPSVLFMQKHWDVMRSRRRRRFVARGQRQPAHRLRLRD